MTWHLRKVAMEDSTLIFNWRNDPLIYRHLFNPNPVEFTNHQQWLKKVLNNPSIHFLIATYEGKNAGTVRFDFNEDYTAAEIGIYLAPELHGKGLSVELLSEAEKEVMKNYSTIKKIIAKVIPLNSASLKMFEKNNYRSQFIQLEKDVENK